jgi:ParB/Sulfiredoxin domain
MRLPPVPASAMVAGLAGMMAAMTDTGFRLAAQEYDPEIDLGQVHEHPGNANVGDIDVLGESMDEHGFYGTILVHRPTGNILYGNHRYRVARAKGATTLPGMWIDCDDEAAAKILAVDNESTRRGHSDEAALLALLEPLSDLRGSGFTAADLAAWRANAAAAAAERGNLLSLAGVVLGEPGHQATAGEVWQLGIHRLVIADVFTGWPAWVPLLEEGAVLMPYPTLLAPHVQTEAPMVMVQPDVYLAGHLLDKWEQITGAPPELVTWA